MKHNLCFGLAFSLLLSVGQSLLAQNGAITIKENPSVNLKRFVPKGSYSGITRISGNTYAVVTDAAERDGFYKFNIVLDEFTGEVLVVENIGFYSSDAAGRNAECVTYDKDKKTIYVGGERNNTIVEYNTQGEATGFRSSDLMPNARANQGLESLCYDPTRHQLWVMNESTLLTDNNGNYTTSNNGVTNMLRLTAYDNRLNKSIEYAYKMDKPESMKKSQYYTNGVSDITVLEDGRLLILEREAFVPKMKYGAWVNCKLYMVDVTNATPLEKGSKVTPESKFLSKSLIWSHRTTMSLSGMNWANYEGMCLGPKLSNGGQVIVLISDSQERYKGVLQDWIKTIVIK